MNLAVRNDLCSGCRTCLLVCALENFGKNNPKLGLLRIVGRFPSPGGYEVRMCDECGACRDACPVEAIREVDGRLRVDDELCTGCLSCVDACPHGVMTYHPSLAAPVKCTHCGMCAAYCPTGAIYDAARYSAEEAPRVTRTSPAEVHEPEAAGGDRNGH